jgi:hypothetical protein
MGNMDIYYRTLELEPEASLPSIKQAYRDLAFIWHPDRVVNNSRLKHKAEGKIKEINEAYQRLRFYQALLQPPEPIKSPVEEPVIRVTEPVVKIKSHPKYYHQCSQDVSVWLY